MGDDESDNSSEEGLSINILPSVSEPDPKMKEEEEEEEEEEPVPRSKHKVN